MTDWIFQSYLRSHLRNQIVFNAANERAVAKFLKGEIKYTDIVRSIEKCMDAHKVSAHPDLEEILATEQWVYSVLQ